MAVLPKLYQHMLQHPNSMLCQIYGVYKLVLHNSEKVRMMVMKNILCTTAPLHRRFDLKGSTQGRYTKKALKDLKPTSILKDLDLDVMFEVCIHKWRQRVPDNPSTTVVPLSLSVVHINRWVLVGGTVWA
jgi:hypothetical protein